MIGNSGYATRGFYFKVVHICTRYISTTTVNGDGTINAHVPSTGIQGVVNCTIGAANADACVFLEGEDVLIIYLIITIVIGDCSAGRQLVHIIGNIASIIIMVMSLSFYQTYVGYALILITVWAVMQLVSDRITITFSKEDRENNRETLKIIMAYVGIIAAMFLYLIIYKFLNAIGYLRYLTERRMDSIVSDTFSSLIDKMIGTYRSFFEYFFADTIIYNGWFGRRYINILVFAAIFAMLVILIVKNKVFRKWYSILLIILALAVVPIIMCMMSIVAAGATIYGETGILMIPHMNSVYVLMILLADQVVETYGQEKLFGQLTLTASRVVSVMVMLILIVFIHVFAGYIDRQQVQITNLGNRLVYRMESLQKYEEGQQVLVVGRPHRGNYSLPDDNYETITKGMISHYSQIFGASEQISKGWIRAFYYFVGVRYSEVPSKTRIELLNSDEVQNMGIYPADDSVKIIDDVVVIKLSEWDPTWE